MKKIVAVVSSLLVLGFLVEPATSQVTTIFSDDFSGSGAPLNGTTPDITTAGEVWEAGDTWFDDGTAESPIAGGADGQAAHLDFTPVTGAIYTAEATILNDNPNWIGFGFLPDDPPAEVTDWTEQSFAVRHSNAPGYAWGLTRNNTGNDQEGFIQGASGETAQPWNGDVVDPTQPVNFRIMLDTTTSNWTAQWFINDAAQGDPVPFEATGNPGIGGIGFSHERSATENSGGTISDFSLVEELIAPRLTLVVNTSTGETVLRNTSEESFSLNYYIVESAGNALDPDGWNSLDDQNVDAGLSADFNNSGDVDGADLAQWEGDYGQNADSDANGDLDSDGLDFLIWQRQFGQAPGPEDQWQEAGGSDSSELAELFLNGATTLGPEEELNLGNAFDPSVFGVGADGDLTFSYGTPDEGLSVGAVVYETGSISALAVPEPSTLVLFFALLAACSVAYRG